MSSMRRHPHERVGCFFLSRQLLLTVVCRPQSHGHIQRTRPWRVFFGARRSTVRRPKRCPARSIRQRLEALSRRRQPQLLVWPLCNLQPRTMLSSPQSQTQRQRICGPRCRGWCLARTVRRPKRCPVISTNLPIACSRARPFAPRKKRRRPKATPLKINRRGP